MIRPEVKAWWVEGLWGPAENFFVRQKITPNQISIVGLAFCLVSGAIIASGHLLIGAWMLFFSSSLDFMDGRIARRTNQQTHAGAFLDSVFDRYADFFIIGAVAFYFRNELGLLVLSLVALLGSSLTPYVRAKAESLSIDCRGGLMQRPGRILSIGLGALVTGLAQAFVPWVVPDLSAFWLELPLVAAIFVIAIFSNWTAIERILSTFKRLTP